MKTINALTLSTALVALAAPALARSQGDMLPGLGLHAVIPTESRSTTAAGPIRVDDNARPF